jgi:hypothetical protein
MANEPIPSPGDQTAAVASATGSMALTWRYYGIRWAVYPL